MLKCVSQLQLQMNFDINWTWKIKLHKDRKVVGFWNSADGGGQGLDGYWDNDDEADKNACNCHPRIYINGSIYYVDSYTTSGIDLNGRIIGYLSFFKYWQSDSDDPFTTNGTPLNSIWKGIIDPITEEEWWCLLTAYCMVPRDACWRSYSVSFSWTSEPDAFSKRSLRGGQCVWVNVEYYRRENVCTDMSTSPTQTTELEVGLRVIWGSSQELFAGVNQGVWGSLRLLWGSHQRNLKACKYATLRRKYALRLRLRLRLRFGLK